MTFKWNIPVPATDPNNVDSFKQTFHHLDWTDGVDVVQAGPSGNDVGLNARFHQIEADLAALNANVLTAMQSIDRLRSQLVEVLGEINTQFNLPAAKTAKEGKDVKDFKDAKDAKDGKDTKDAKDGKDGKDGKDAKDGKDGKDAKDAKDGKDKKDGKDGKDAKDAKEKEGKEAQWGAAEKVDRTPIREMASFLWESTTQPADGVELGAPGVPAAGRSFIRPDERPPVGERAIKGAEEPPR